MWALHLPPIINTANHFWQSCAIVASLKGWNYCLVISPFVPTSNLFKSYLAYMASKPHAVRGEFINKRILHPPEVWSLDCSFDYSYTLKEILNELDIYYGPWLMIPECKSGDCDSIAIDYIKRNINMFLIIFYLYGFSTTISHIRNSENVNTK